MNTHFRKRISATDAKNNFGGLLEDVAALGWVEIVKHGRPVAVVLSPRAFAAQTAGQVTLADSGGWGRTHMIPAELARAAKVVRSSTGFGDD